MEKKYHLLWNILPVIGLIIWGAFGITENLWYDEAYSAALISHTTGEIISITMQDVHSPFYYFLLKGVWGLLGSVMGFRCLKWFSILAMLGYLMLGKYYVKKLFGEKVSVNFMFFSIAMPIMTIQSGNVRMYALSLFFVTLTTLLILDILRNSSLVKWRLLIVASAGSVYCHTYAMLQAFFLYAIFFCVIIYQKKYKLLKGFFISGISVAVLFMPWLFVTYQQMQNRTGSSIIGQGARQLIMTMLKNSLTEWFTAAETPILTVKRAEIVLCLFLFWHAFRWMKARCNYIPVLGIAAMALSIVVGVLIYIFTGQGFSGRHFFPCFASVMILYAVGMEQLRLKILKALVLLTALLCFLLQYRSELELEYDPGLETWKSFVEENVEPGDVIMASNLHALYLGVYYPDLEYMLYGNMPEFSPFQNTGVFKEWEQLEERTGNIWYVFLPGMGNEPDLLKERYTWEEVDSFHFMYYDFVIAKLEHINTITLSP